MTVRVTLDDGKTYDIDMIEAERREVDLDAEALIENAETAQGAVNALVSAGLLTT